MATVSQIRLSGESWGMMIGKHVFIECRPPQRWCKYQEKQDQGGRAGFNKTSWCLRFTCYDATLPPLKWQTAMFKSSQLSDPGLAQPLKKLNACGRVWRLSITVLSFVTNLLLLLQLVLTPLCSCMRCMWQGIRDKFLCFAQMLYSIERNATT